MPDPQPVADPAPPPAVRRFCSRCGAAWNPGWSDCLACKPAAAPAPARRGGIGDALLVYFLLLGSFVLVLIDGGSSGTEMFIQALDTAIVLLCAIGMNGRLNLGVTRLGRPIWYAAAVGLGVATFLVATVCVEGLVWLGIEEIRTVDGFLADGYGWGVMVVAIVVQPAVIEELAFRGIILDALRTTLSAREAVIVSAMMFMVLHLAVASFPHLLLIGLTLGCLRVWSGSLWPCVLMHAVHNGLVVVTEAGEIAH